jgi:hypothetical protein
MPVAAIMAKIVLVSLPTVTPIEVGNTSGAPVMQTVFACDTVVTISEDAEDLADLLEASAETHTPYDEFRPELGL